MPCLLFSLISITFHMSSVLLAQLLYQEYSDVVLNKEIQSQQRLDSIAEEPRPASPRQRQRASVSPEPSLQRLSMVSSASLWQEIPMVRNSTVLLSMTHEDQKLQEVTQQDRLMVGGVVARCNQSLKLGAITLSTHHHPLSILASLHMNAHTMIMSYLHSDAWSYTLFSAPAVKLHFSPHCCSGPI